MKELKLALDKFESVNSSLKDILNSLDAKNIISSQEELTNLKQKNKLLEKSHVEAIEKINKVISRINNLLDK